MCNLLLRILGEACFVSRACITIVWRLGFLVTAIIVEFKIYESCRLFTATLLKLGGYVAEAHSAFRQHDSQMV